MKPFLLTLILCLPLHAQFLKWQSIGPVNATFSGRVGIGAIAASQQNPDIAYVGGASGGVWRTSDGGTSWTPVTEGLPTQAAACLSVDPNNDQTVYYGTGDILLGAYGAKGLYRTTNSGSSWSLVSSSLGVPVKIIVDANDSRKVYVAGYNGFYRSTDAGVSWTNTLGGHLWDAVSVDGLNFLATSQSRGIYKSTDAGINWRKVTTGLPDSTQMYRTSVGQSRSSSNIVYAAVGNSTGGLTGFYKSIDAGESWNRLPYSQYTINPSGWMYTNCVTINPTNPDIVFIGNFNPYRSTDGGQTWSTMIVTSNYAVHPDVHCFAWSQGTLYTGTDGGVYKTTNNGELWTNLNTNIVLTQFRPGLALDRMNPAVVWGGTQDNGAFKITGQIATHKLSTDIYAMAVDPTNSDIVYTASPGPYRTTDGGATWTMVRSGIADYGWATAPLLINPQNPAILYYGTTYFYISNNRGDSWNSVWTFPSTVSNMTLNPSNPNIIYASLLDGTMHKTTNGGTDWSQVMGFPITHADGFYADGFNNVYVAGSASGSRFAWKSNTGGQTSFDLTGDLPSSIKAADAIIPDPYNSNVIYLGTDFGLYYTTNGGSNWTHDEGIPNVKISDLGITSDRNYIVVETWGRGMYKSALPEATIPTSSVSLMYPNGGDSLKTGSMYNVSWIQTGVTTVRIEYSSDNGTTWALVTGGTPATTGAYTLSTFDLPTTTRARVRVSDSTNVSTTDQSDTTFTVYTPPSRAGISFKPTSLNFGNVHVGKNKGMNITVSNPGTDTLRVYNISTPTGFIATKTAFNLKPLSSLNVQIKFYPTTIGSYTGNVTFNHNATGSSSSVTVSGMGQ